MARIEPIGKAYNISRNRSIRLTSYRATFVTPTGKSEVCIVRALTPQQATTLAKMMGEDKGWIIDTIVKVPS